MPVFFPADNGIDIGIISADKIVLFYIETAECRRIIPEEKFSVGRYAEFSDKCQKFMKHLFFFRQKIKLKGFPEKQTDKAVKSDIERPRMMLRDFRGLP